MKKRRLIATRQSFLILTVFALTVGMQHSPKAKRDLYALQAVNIS
jgi:hypothetical protein